MYGEYPSLKPEDHLDGDLLFNNDFRQTYTTLLEDWLHLDAPEIVNGNLYRENGVGLANTRERLSALYDDNYALVVSKNVPYGLKINMRMPFETEAT